ncbi:hypothetical protein BDV37DRAFT_274354 [Aspergillus pseudonomiae]|uniref:Fungal-type protein kinase domain-containing protein n=1 Tax=Aspergillus pseudonomiae TaxID=1506151 RepID=A0A5N7D273_9EURO|nr:uncharacterized protein BDV37DRAFT_274354 [Aspergillus pseudonomiae]KAE8400506.1 hypothetical protein BDV37DRAFT_274354 [Aspergillus pseudonomiae]
MARTERPDVRKAASIAGKLDVFRDGFRTICQESGLPPTLDSLNLQNLALDLVSALRSFPDMRKLPSANSRKNILSDLLRLTAVISSDDFDFDNLMPLLRAVLNQEPEDVIWDRIYSTVIESTPPPKLLPFFNQTPYLHTTSSFVNSSGHRKHVDAVLKEELGPIYIGIPQFYESFFRNIDGLEAAGNAVFQELREGDTPLYCDGSGWQDWPKSTQEKEVLEWLNQKFNLLRNLAGEKRPSVAAQRKILTRPSQPLQGSSTKRKLDVAIVKDIDQQIEEGGPFDWSRVLVPGELKSSPDLDTASNTWRDLGRYAREVFSSQETRRFVLGFTLCGPIMRLWEFDRLGAIASSPFDVNKDGLQFVLAILGYFWMNDEQLGFDPSIMTSADGRRFIEISRNGRKERLVFDELVKMSSCVAGRATTCWKAHMEDGSNTPVVIKDSWQYPEREEEGKLLQEVTEKGIINVARYFYHETVCVNGEIDDVRENVRKGIDVTKASNYKPASNKQEEAKDTARLGRSKNRSRTGHKRSSSCAEVPLPPSKRTCSSSSNRKQDLTPQNRIHRRVCIRDYGKSICRATSRVALLNALQSCLEGYESLHAHTGILQGDISTGNLMINEDKKNGSWPAFLIDLDLAIKEQREQPSGARGKTGTRAFMAIGLLLGEKHCFHHDLESFFWVLFWICIHYDGPGKDVGPTDFDCWNYDDDQKLANSKKGVVDDEADFEQTAEKYFTSYYKVLVPWVNELRRVVFPGGTRRKKPDKGLYIQMKNVLEKAAEELKMLGI